MNKLEFLHWLQNYESSLGHWKVSFVKNSKSQYTLGCYKDYNSGKYVVYENDEHSHSDVLITENQDEAYDELKSMVLFEVRNNKGYI